MSKKKLKLPDGWENDKDFAEFFKDYVENDTYLREENEHLQTYITYRALYKVYIHSINAQSKIKSITERISQFSDSLEQVNNGLNLLQKVIDEQEKINESAKFHIKLMVVISIGIFIVGGYFMYQLFIVGAFILF